MDIEEFRKYGHEVVDWIASYYENIRDYPVKSQVSPGEIFNKLDSSAPEEGQQMSKIFKDFEDIIMPGITHWQSPGFHAYFPGSTSFPSLLAEMLTSAIGAQCMIWDTSPAAAELEEMVMIWLRDMIGLPSSFTGVIQDTASTATLCALITAREKKSDFEVNDIGFADRKNMRIYCSAETHSSVEKAVKIMGVGKNNLVKVGVDENLAVDVRLLREAIRKDLEAGHQPLAVVAAIGTTGTVAIDPLKEIAAVCKEFDLWLHVDAAYAGTALILEEYRWMIEGVEAADSFVFNPHKWMFTNFDCSAYFVKNESDLINAFSILPEYLKTNTTGKVKDYRDWGIQLGRRFRALKLWFVIRSFGVDGMKRIIRGHIEMTKKLGKKIQEHPKFEVLSVSLNLVCFRLKPYSGESLDEINQRNKKLMDDLNASGKVYLTHTKIGDKLVLRMVTGQTYLTEADVARSWEVIRSTIEKEA